MDIASEARLRLTDVTRPRLGPRMFRGVPIATLVALDVTLAACLPAPHPPIPASTLETAEEVEAIVSVELNAPPNGTAAYAVFVDGQLDSEVLIFSGISKRHYAAVVGPLAAGSHEISLKPSSNWATRPPPVHSFRVDIVDRHDARFEEVRHAPAIWLRPDTIGRESDLPLVMYAEEVPERLDELQYSVIFSNEDGGTATRALMARWGRTTDIEWVCTVLRRGGPPRERFQGLDHETREFAGEHRGSHPLLLVATKNNVFADHGTSAVLARPVPRMVDLTRATRESVMDTEPWTYALMARELETEGKLTPLDTSPNEADLIHDPREYVYLEAHLSLQHATVAAAVTLDDGRSVTSDGGRSDLRIARSGWVRTAVPAGPEPVAAVAWSCEPGQGPSRPAGEPARATCRVEATRAFRIADDHTVGAELITPADRTLTAGEVLSIPTSRPRR